MFNKLKEFLHGEQTELSVDRSGNPTDQELQVATAVLLFEMASADSSIARAEANAVCETMASQFSIPEDQIPDLIEMAVAARQREGKIDEFVKVINEHFNAVQKQKILGMIWKVVKADGDIDTFESRFATQMKFRFQLSDEQAAEAKDMF